MTLLRICHSVSKHFSKSCVWIFTFTARRPTSVRHKSVFYRNGWKAQAGFQHRG